MADPTIEAKYYNINLKSIQFGDLKPHNVAAGTATNSNSLVDSGTPNLVLPMTHAEIINAFNAIDEKFGALISQSFWDYVPLTSLNGWPDITLTVEGMDGDVKLTVAPENYWQLNAASQPGYAKLVLKAANGRALLGLPLMNNYFCVFDRSTDNGAGVIKFANINLNAIC